MTSTAVVCSFSHSTPADHPIPDPEIMLFAAVMRESLMAASRSSPVR
jgi:hypothetical protein